MKKIYRIMMNTLGRIKTTFLRRMGLVDNNWAKGLPEEVVFWEQALMDPQKNWRIDEFQQRTDPQLPLQDDLRFLLEKNTGNVIRILDVGSGPLTRLGKRWDDKLIEITATDPLADEYNKIFGNLGIVPLVAPVKIKGEELSSAFQSNYFDLAYASNSLDHAINPLEVIRQMISLVKLGSSVYLWHFVDSGINERYKGLHQWNFSRSHQDLIIHDGKEKLSVRKGLGSSVQVTCRDDFAFNSPVVIAIIKRLS